MKHLRAALLLPPAAALLARAEIATLAPIFGMVLLLARATGLLTLPPRRWVLPVLSIPFLLQASLLPADTGYGNLLQLYAIGAHYLFWIGIQQALTRGRENGALPFALGSIAASSLHLPPDQLRLPLLAILLLPIALVPIGTPLIRSRSLSSRFGWIGVWLLSLLLALGISVTYEKKRFRWSGRHFGSGDVLLGFSEKSNLNRPPGTWTSRRKDQVVLRLEGEGCAVRLSGRNYSRYRNGVWSVSGRDTALEPTGRRVSHHLFGRPRSDLPWVRVESPLPLDGTLFLPRSPGAVALLADTLRLSTEGTPSLHSLVATPSPWLFQSTPPDERDDPDLPEAYRLSTPPGLTDFTLPPELVPWLDSLAVEVWGTPEERSGLSIAEKAEKLRQWFASSFRYDWNNPRPIDGEPLRGFVSERRGYCDHFSSLGALLLRNEGIPTRWTKGYLPGGRIGSGCAVRRVDAHSWILIGIDGKWIEGELTPSEGMERTAIGGWRLWQEKFQQVIGGVRYAVFHGEWRLWLEEGALRWERWGVLLPVAALLFVGVWWIRRRIARRKLLPELRLWPRAERLLRAEGIAVSPGKNIAEVIERLEEMPKTRRIEEGLRLLREYQRIRWR